MWFLKYLLLLTLCLVHWYVSREMKFVSVENLLQDHFQLDEYFTAKYIFKAHLKKLIWNLYKYPPQSCSQTEPIPERNLQSSFLRFLNVHMQCTN